MFVLIICLTTLKPIPYDRPRVGVKMLGRIAIRSLSYTRNGSALNYLQHKRFLWVFWENVLPSSCYDSNRGNDDFMMIPWCRTRTSIPQATVITFMESWCRSISECRSHVQEITFTYRKMNGVLGQLLLCATILGRGQPVLGNEVKIGMSCPRCRTNGSTSRPAVPCHDCPHCVLGKSCMGAR